MKEVFASKIKAHFISHHVKMGQEQSASHAGQISRPNVPHTSYSHEKDTSKTKSKQRARIEDILVVNAPSGKANVVSKSDDPDLRNLNKTPFFYPLIRASINAPAGRELNVFDQFDPRPGLILCSRYENHLKQCAAAVSFDQHMLSSQIREMDAYCSSVLRRVNERYKYLATARAQLRKVEEVRVNLKRIDANLKLLVPMMDRLNNTLPVQERLEEFTLGSYSIQNKD